ncbi:MAG TPA: hypothetical protein VN805_12545 [Caulobacteraceae bacterium]|nr:hypothetical protein [Caulobacteraceae bacterium]
MGDVDAPGERLVDLRPALGPRLLDGGVGVDLAGGGGHEALRIVQRAAASQRAPPVAWVFSGQREMDADI